MLRSTTLQYLKLHHLDRISHARLSPVPGRSPTPSWILALLTAILISGCQTAFLTFPGGSLKGDEVSTDSFAFASEFKLLQLEVRPENPYSVWLRVIVKNRQLYIDAADKRRWHRYLKEDPNVRIKLGKLIYLATMTEVTDQKLLEGFLNSRTVYRLDPR